MSVKLPEIIAQIEEQGFTYRGHFNVAAGEDFIDFSIPLKSVIMVGNVGSAMWTNFCNSSEFADGEPDPLNRFSKRNGDALAQICGGLAVYPSDPKHYPFMQWAMRALPVEKSMMQILIDAKYGLWHAYRYAILLPYTLPQQEAFQSPRICQQCQGQPCLYSCPVNAYSAKGFDMNSCRQYLNSNPRSQCAKGFCQARVACPQGQQFRYQAAHAQFHMQAFNV